MSQEVKNILEDLGFSLKDFGKYYRAKPIYRESNNETSFQINKSTGFWIDFSANKKGNIDDLIKICLNCSSSEEIKSWKDNKGHKDIQIFTPKTIIKLPKIFSESEIEHLEKDHSYWVNKGISLDTINTFEGGVSKEGRMKGRYVFPIYNSRKKIVGLSGRDLYNNSPSRPKWKHLGGKLNWVYPLFFNKKEVKDSNSIILVESIGDMLSLYQAGIKNSMVLFGVNLGAPRINFLLKINPARIIIATNNDFNKDVNTGSEAAIKIKRSLQRHFDEDQIIISLPDKKDFGEMSSEDIKEWHGKI